MNMMLRLDQAGARHSQSPVFAEKGAVIHNHDAPQQRLADQYCSHSKRISASLAKQDAVRFKLRQLPSKKKSRRRYAMKSMPTNLP